MLTIKEQKRRARAARNSIKLKAVQEKMKIALEHLRSIDLGG
jgi:predicted rRNA methylase YqxC with S4 and FtsJ domains